jgi:hypothetical protein
VSSCSSINTIPGHSEQMRDRKIAERRSRIHALLRSLHQGTPPGCDSDRAMPLECISCQILSSGHGPKANENIIHMMTLRLLGDTVRRLLYDVFRWAVPFRDTASRPDQTDTPLRLGIAAALAFLDGSMTARQNCGTRLLARTLAPFATSRTCQRGAVDARFGRRGMICHHMRR